MSNSRKRTKFPQLKKLANPSTFNGAHVTEITKTCTVAFIKARHSLFDVKRNVSIRKKKKKMVKIHFSKLLLIDFSKHRS